MTTKKLLVEGTDQYVLLVSTGVKSIPVQPANCVGIVQTDDFDRVSIAEPVSPPEGAPAAPVLDTPLLVIDNSI